MYAVNTAARHEVTEASEPCFFKNQSQFAGRICLIQSEHLTDLTEFVLLYYLLYLVWIRAATNNYYFLLLPFQLIN